MEQIPGYDAWKTTPPEPSPTDKYCTSCGEPIYEGETYYDKGFGEILCPECNESGKHIA